MCLASFGEVRTGPSLPQQLAVLVVVVVVATVRKERVGPAAGPADDIAHARDRAEQRRELSDVAHT
ncbi:hypothetical protein [Streptomyces sp. NPDC096311]|uniref:hypothetical protein n=1 Tax=Streptomyces sp. NPDC096311 TaxID=3366083 RepID=UPI00382C95D0